MDGSPLGHTGRGVKPVFPVAFAAAAVEPPSPPTYAYSLRAAAARPRIKGDSPLKGTWPKFAGISRLLVLIC